MIPETQQREVKLAAAGQRRIHTKLNKDGGEMNEWLLDMRGALIETYSVFFSESNFKILLIIIE